jgi:hypothetical protein
MSLWNVSLCHHHDRQNRFSGVNDTAEIDFLGEYEAICETALGRESEQGGIVWWKKTEGRKSGATVPLSVSNKHMGDALGLLHELLPYFKHFWSSLKKQQFL